MKLKTKVQVISETKSGYRVELTDGTKFSLLRRGRFLVARVMVQGRAVNLSTKRSEARDAASYAAPLIQQAILGRFEVVEQAQSKTVWPTVQELADRYLNNGNHEGTLKYRRRVVVKLKLVLREALGTDNLSQLRANQLTARLLSDWKASRIEGLDGTELVSAKRTVNSALSSVRAIFSQRLVDSDGSPYEGLALPECLSGWARVPKFGKVKVTNNVREARPIVEAKLAQIHELKETDPAAYLVCALAAQCGLRAGEAINARKSWIGDGTIKIQATEDWLPKSRQSREVPLPDDLKADILFLSDDSDRIVPTSSRWMLFNRLAAWFKKDGDWPFDKHVHEFRRWAGANVLTQTGSMEAAREFLGHSSVTVTEQHYAGLLERPKFEIKLPVARVA
tara:strand:+ start:1332 stop:2513 length:1182 start_codon:yes stop_codon:yes gene_type:complete